MEEGESREFRVAYNSELGNRVIDLANARHDNVSSTMRLLVGIGLDMYEIHELAGRNTAKKVNAWKAQELARAKAINASRNRKKSDGESLSSLDGVITTLDVYNRMQEKEKQGGNQSDK